MGKTKAPKFYAVKIGRQPGVFASWAECEAQTKNFSGARHKSFSSKVSLTYLTEYTWTFLAPVHACAAG